MLRFEQGRLNHWGDIERCPYAFHDPEWSEWSRKDDKRLLLIALERYLIIFDYLQKTHQYLKEHDTYVV